jgi:uncharacterized protein (TIGR02444 family)
MSGREKRSTMAEAETTTEATPFWRFSLHFYRQPGVSDACLALQDDCGVDVNLLLFLLWLAGDGRLLSATDVRTLDDKVRDWRDLTIVPIRDARRRLKGARTLVGAGEQEAFRRRVKALELEAERLQQQALYGLTGAGPLGAARAPQEAARGNVTAYERAIGAAFPKAQVDVLLGAFAALNHGGLAAASAAAGEEDSHGQAR